MKKVINFLIYPVIIFLILFALLSILNIPVFGFRLFRIGAESMNPYIKKGDYILVREKENYEVGDVITFKVTDGYVTNRIISVDLENDAIITKGDANEERDISSIKRESISGSLFYRFRLLGYVYYILYKWETWAIIAVIYILADKVDFTKKKKKKKKEKEEDKEEEEKEEEQEDDFIELLK